MADDDDEVRGAKIIVEMPKLTLSAMVDPTPTPTRMFGDSPVTDSNASPRKRARNPFEESFRRASLQINPMDFRMTQDEPLETPVIPKIHEWPRVETARSTRERRTAKKPPMVNTADKSIETPFTVASAGRNETQHWSSEHHGTSRISVPTEVSLEENAMHASSQEAVLIASRELPLPVNVRSLRLPNGKTVPVIPDPSTSMLPCREIGGSSDVLPNASSDTESFSRKERNRAAAVRSREKRKKEIQALQKRNGALIAENAALKKENEELKQKIIALTNCFIPQTANSNPPTVQQPVTLIVPPPVNLTPNIVILSASGHSFHGGNIPILPKT